MYWFLWRWQECPATESPWLLCIVTTCLAQCTPSDKCPRLKTEIGRAMERRIYEAVCFNCDPIWTMFPIKTGMILVLNVLKNLENALKKCTCPLIWLEDHSSRPDPCLDRAHTVQWGILELNLALQLLAWHVFTGENHIFFKRELRKWPPRIFRPHNNGSSQAKLKALAVLVAVFNIVLPLCLGK